jgi:hypothetical protein
MLFWDYYPIDAEDPSPVLVLGKVEVFVFLILMLDYWPGVAKFGSTSPESFSRGTW